MSEPLIIDMFAGGGGASLGIERATGRKIDIAINHNAAAIRMHAANHPGALHLQDDVRKVKPLAVVGGRAVDLLWASPDCTHHSKAKGGKPRSKRLRGLAWMVVRWLKLTQPNLLFLENVEEFAQWGPLLDDGRPCPFRKGESFKRWIRAIKSLGYKVEWRVLVAADFGAPTTRKRLYLIARRDGRPIVWPDPTHAKDPGGNLHTMHLAKWRSAAECIDWTIPCPSIFERKKPLAENTQKRIAEGIRRYVIECAEPFLVGIDNASGSGVWAGDEPLRTVTGENRFGLVAPSLVQTGYGEREGQSPRVMDITQPLGTVLGENHRALCAAFLAKHYTGVVGQAAGDPLGTVTAVDHHSAVVATICGVGGRAGQSPPRGLNSPLATVTAKADAAIVTAQLEVMYSNSAGANLREPMPTITASGHLAEVRAFLTKWYGTGCGQKLSDPAATVTSKDRLGLVLVRGEQYQIVDIGLRMLRPRELARAMGFPDDYQLPGTITEQVARIGNAVCPDMAEALVRANYRPVMAAQVAA